MDSVPWHFERRGSAWAIGLLLGIGLLSGQALGGQFTYPNGSFGTQPHGSPAAPAPGVLLAEFDQLFAGRYAITLQLLPEQVQGGPYLSCLASICITDTHNGRQGLLLSPQFSVPEASLRPYVEQVREPEYAERIHPGVHRVLLKTSDYSHPLPGEGEQTLQFERGFAFADLDHDGQLELFIAQFMAGQRWRTAYSVYALEALAAGEQTQLDPIDDPALRDLDSASTLDLAAQTLSKHSSGSAYDSLTERYQLLPRHKNPPAAQFDQRQRYHLTSVSGASTTGAPPGHYYQIDRRYRYAPAADGSWQQQLITIHEVLHPMD